ncbi:MAG: FHA domain-containing protein [Proteobacteria bacterium]|nr:FHA domain-containing protein [Pseudomonadota bacterium]
MDQSKKTMRHFYCRDVLWETFEQMANDFDCSIDYLVNEAMRYYARSKNYQPPGAPGPGGPGPGPGTYSEANGAGAPASRNNAPASTGAAPAAKPMRPPNSGTQPPPQPPAPAARRPAPPTPGYGRGANAAGGMGSAVAPPEPVRAPVPVPAAGGPTLFLVYNGQRYPVTKDQFIIGRGSKTSDLPIKDGNISRKHAAVIRRNGTFYIKDLGSTNGIDYKGMRIDNKRIDEGDIFHLCDYELRFTYRTDGG